MDKPNRPGKQRLQAPHRRVRWAGVALAALLGAIGLVRSAPACAGETTTYVLTDVQGTVLAREDAHGTTIAQYDYRPYGELQAGPAVAGPSYTGHVADPDAGLVYMQARYYDPDRGGFLSVDPVGPSPGNLFSFNRYDYTNNNPVKNVDIDGKSPCPSERCFSFRVMESLDINTLKEGVANIADKFSGHVNGPDDKAGFNVTGLVAGKVKISGSGTAAGGGGVHAQVGLLNSNSSLGIVTPALGTSASVDANVVTLSYKASDEPLSGALMTAGAEVHDLPGGRITFSYEPPDKFSLSLDAGTGVGASAHLYSVEAENDFSVYEHYDGGK